MHGNMSCVHGYDAVARIEHGVDDGGVGLCPSHKEFDARLRTSDEFAYHFPGMLAPFVIAVGGAVTRIGIDQMLKHEWMGAVIVIAVEMSHFSWLFKVKVWCFVCWYVFQLRI